MIELIQFPWSPFCIVQRRILEFSGAPFKITNIPNADRSLVWRLTRQRYYGVPIIRDGKIVVFEIERRFAGHRQIPRCQARAGAVSRGNWRACNRIIWRYIENEIEGRWLQAE